MAPTSCATGSLESGPPRQLAYLSSGDFFLKPKKPKKIKNYRFQTPKSGVVVTGNLCVMNINLEIQNLKPYIPKF